ncbi:hypothetical protein ACLB2K_076769 [Fragaria x ananassa]
MPHGTLEVLLVGAKDLADHDFFGKMDPYVLLSLRTQEKKSTVASGQGSAPEWNETFQFTVSSDDVTELSLKIYDKDTFTPDDFLGEATIPLETVFMEGSTEPTKYNVVNENNEYHGDITVGLTFTRERTGSRAGGYDEEEHGGRHGGSRRRHGDSRGESSDDEDSRRGGYGNSTERYGVGDTDSRRGGGYGNSRERHGGDDHSRTGGYDNSRERCSDDDESGGGYGESRGRRGGRRESNEEESYGGYKESSYRY